MKKYVITAICTLLCLAAIIPLFIFPPYRDIVKDWQSLIGSVLTLVAAAIAVIPVWRQLERTSVQTATMHREFLINQLQILRSRRSWIMNFMWSFGNKVQIELYEMREVRQVEISPEWAHNMDLEAASIRFKLSEFRRERLDNQKVEAGLNSLSASLDIIWNLLDQIHRPASTSVSYDTVDISPEQARSMSEKSEAAKTSIEEAIETLRSDIRTVDKLYGTQIEILNHKISRAEQMLISAD